MANNPLISVLMPVYNVKEEYLRDAIESILKQSYSNFEFLILDDGSTNNSAEVILSYKDQRIKYMKNDVNKGISISRNILMDNACGKYMACMDSDDISLPQRFRMQLEFMEKNPDIDILGTAYRMFPNGKNVILPQSSKEIKQAMLTACCMAHPTVFIRKSAFDKEKFYYNNDFCAAEDYGLWCKLVRKLKFANLPEILLYYRWHENNISVTKKDTQHLGYCKIRFRHIMEILNLDIVPINTIIDKVLAKQEITLEEYIKFSGILVSGLNAELEDKDYNPAYFKNYINTLHNKALKCCHKNRDLCTYLCYSKTEKMFSNSLWLRIKFFIKSASSVLKAQQ